MDELLLTLLHDDGNELSRLLQRKQNFARMFETKLIDNIIGSSATSRSSVELSTAVCHAVSSFLAAPTPTLLETFFLRVATMIHCYTAFVVGIADNATPQLPSGVRGAATAIASVLLSPRFQAVHSKGCNCFDDGDDNSGSSEQLQGPQALWFCFLCVFLQQLSARGGDFTQWRNFFLECKSFSEKCNITNTKVADNTKVKENYTDSGDDNLAVAAWGALSEELFSNTIARTRFRRTAILCKSFCPHLVAQAPGTTYQLLRTLHSFMSEWEAVHKDLTNEIENKETREKEEEIINRHSDKLGHLLADGQVHCFLLSTVIGALLSSKYILSKRETRVVDGAKWYQSRSDTAVQSEQLWRDIHFPPIGLLLDRLHIKPLLGVHLFTFCMQLCIGLSPTHYAEGRQKLALCLYLTGSCSLRVALAVYHFSGTQFLHSMFEEGVEATLLPGEELASLSAALDNYVQEAHSELIFSTSETEATRQRHSNNKQRQHYAADGLNNSDEVIPTNGELTGPRFAKTVFPVPCPTWTQYLAESKSAAETSSLQSAAAGKKPSTTPTSTFTKQAASSQSVIPCKFVLKLLELGLPGLAAETIAELQTEMGVNVCLVPAVAMPGVGSVASNTMQRIQVILNENYTNSESECGIVVSRGLFSASMRALEAYFPLLSTIYAYVASQVFLCSLVETITRECGRHVHIIQQEQRKVDKSKIINGTSNTAVVEFSLMCRNVLALAERYLVFVVMPCMRVIESSPILYDRVQLLLTLLKEKGPAVNFGTNSAEFLHTAVWLNKLVHPSPLTSRALRAPHDVLRSKELEALFAQSLKRMTQCNVGRYRKLLRRVIYANPLYVADKLFQQAVGYSNNFLKIHTKLLKSAPAAVLTLIAQVGLAFMRRYAEAERIGTADANRVGLIATFLSVLWRENPHKFDGCILLRAAEYALRRESRASIVFGLELLKSILHEMLGLTLEHEEQYSAAQVKALIAPPSTQWFAKGAAESFRRGCWDAFFTPAVLATASSILRGGLQEPCEVPVEEEEEQEDGTEEEEKEKEQTAGAAGMRDMQQGQAPEEVEDEGGQSRQRDGKRPNSLNLTLGQCLLLHLCRLHSRIYTVQADLSGTMQLLLLTCARDYNVINDLILSMEALLSQGPPAEEIFMVAMPHIAFRLTARFAAKKVQHEGSNTCFAAMSFETDDDLAEGVASFNNVDSVIPFSILRKLSYHTAAHFVFDESVYNAAMKELNQFFNHATAILKGKNNDKNVTADDKNNGFCSYRGGENIAGLSRDPTICWLQEQTRQIRHEREAHRKFYEGYEAKRTLLLEDLHRNGVFNEPVVFAASYLLPRALLSLEDTLFVYHFIRWLLNVTRSGSYSNGCNEGNISEDYNRVVDIVLSLVTASMTFFVGFTDGECKRLGFLLSLLLTALQETTVEMPPLLFDINGEAKTKLPTMGEKENEVVEKKATDASLVSGGGTAGSFSSSMAAFTTEAIMEFLEPHPRSMMCIMAEHAKTSSLAAPVASGCINKDVMEFFNINVTTKNREKKLEPAAFLSQLEAYLCRALVQLLLHQQDVAFLHRNVFLILERLTRSTSGFPFTVCATEWMISAVAPHAVRSSSCYASATAVLKMLQDNLQRKREMLKLVSSHRVMLTDQRSNDEMEQEVQKWKNMWEMREAFVRSLLALDIAAAKKIRVPKTDIENDDDDDNNNDNDNDNEDNVNNVGFEEGEKVALAEVDEKEKDTATEEEEEVMNDLSSKSSGLVDYFSSEGSDNEGSDIVDEHQAHNIEHNCLEEGTGPAAICCDNSLLCENDGKEEIYLEKTANRREKRQREKRDSFDGHSPQAVMRLEVAEDIERKEDQ